MRIKLILFALIFANGNIIYAQSLKVGIEGGISASITKTEYVMPGWLTTQASTFRPGIRIGIPVKYALTNKLSLCSGLYTAMKGTTKTSETAFTKSLSYNSLEIPLALLYTQKGENKSSFFIGGGVYMGYVLGAKTRYKNSNGQTIKETARFGANKGTDDLRHLDYGLQVQTGVEFQNGFLLRLIVQRQFNDLANKRAAVSPPYSSFDQIKNLAFASITLGYLLQFKQKH